MMVMGYDVTVLNVSGLINYYIFVLAAMGKKILFLVATSEVAGRICVIFPENRNHGLKTILNV